MSVAKAKKTLAHSDASQRRAAVHALSETPNAVEPLIAILENEEHPAVREAAISALLSIGPDELVEACVLQLRGDEANRRNEAVQVLQQMGPQSSSVIQELLADADPDVRIMAVDVTRMLTNPEVSTWLRELLETEDHPNVVGTVVDRLCEIGWVEDIPALENAQMRFSDDAYLQFAIDRALTRIKNLDAEASK